MTAKCSGCTSYQGNDGNEAVINATGITQFAWAQGTTAVQTPSNNASAFNVHLVFGKWNHDLNAARSSNFETWVTSNLLSEAVESSSAVVATTVNPTIAPATSVSKRASTLATSVVAAPKASSTGNGKIPSSCSGAGSPVFSVSLDSLISRSSVSCFACFVTFSRQY
jgi:hypothetical protein